MVDETEKTHRSDLAHAVRGEKPGGTRRERLAWVIENHQAARIHGCFVDVQTAALVAAFMDRAKERGEEDVLRRMNAMPMQVLAARCWAAAAKVK